MITLLVPGDLVPGDHPLVPGDHPLVPGDHPPVPGDHPLLPGYHPLVPGDHPLVPGDIVVAVRAHPLGYFDRDDRRVSRFRYMVVFRLSKIIGFTRISNIQAHGSI